MATSGNQASSRWADLRLKLWRQRLQRSDITTSSPTTTSDSGNITRNSNTENHISETTSVIPTPDGPAQNTATIMMPQEDLSSNLSSPLVKTSNGSETSEIPNDTNSTYINETLKSVHSEWNQSFMGDSGEPLPDAVTSGLTQNEASWHRVSNVSLLDNVTFLNHTIGNDTENFWETSEFSASVESFINNVTTNATDWLDKEAGHVERPSNKTCFNSSQGVPDQLNSTQNWTTSDEVSDFSDTSLLSDSSSNTTTEKNVSNMVESFTNEGLLAQNETQNVTLSLGDEFLQENDTITSDRYPSSDVATSDIQSSVDHATPEPNPLLTYCQPEAKQDPPISKGEPITIPGKHTNIDPKEEILTSQPTPSEEAKFSHTSTGPTHLTSQEATSADVTTTPKQTTSGYMYRTTEFDPLTNRGGPFLRKPNAFDFLMMGQIATAQRNEKQREFRESNYEASAQICGLLNKKFCRLSIGGRCC